MTDEIKDQLLAKPTILYAAAFVMFILAIVPGMPHLAFLSFTGLLPAPPLGSKVKNSASGC